MLCLWGAEDDVSPAVHAAALTVQCSLFVQGFVAASGATTPRLVWAICGAQFLAKDGVSGPACTSVWGLGRVVQQLHPDLALTFVDLSAGPLDATPAPEFNALAQVMAQGFTEAEVAELENHGVRVSVAQADLSNRASVAAALDSVPEPSAICAVFHLAGVLDDAVLGRRSVERIHRAMGPKAPAPGTCTS